MTSPDILRFDRKVEIADAAAYGLDRTVINLRFVLPSADRLASHPIVFFCSPGGGMSGLYYDIGGDDAAGFSFARAMADRGWISVLIDNLGTGESSRPEDGYLLHPETVAAVSLAAFAQAAEMVRAGVDGYPPVPEFCVIGVGHSMGGMLTSFMQARGRLFDAIAILGAGPYGLPNHVPEPLKPYVGDPEGLRRDLIPVFRRNSMPPYVELTQRAEQRRSASAQARMESVFSGGEKAGVAAMKAARSTLIATGGLFVIVPGSWSPEATAIDVPIFLFFGEQDICPDPYMTPGLFTGSRDITLYVAPETGHSHFVFPSRTALWERLAAWAQGQRKRES